MMLLEIGLRIGTIVVACSAVGVSISATRNMTAEYAWLYRLVASAVGFVFPFVLAEWVFNIY